MKILVVVDMQNDFVTGALKNEDAEKIIPNVVAKVKEYEDRQVDPIYFTQDTHDGNYLNTIEGKKLPIPHCIFGTKGWEIIPELQDYSGYPTRGKGTFGSTNLGHDLYMLAEHLNPDNEPVESIEIIGLCTDICVISNAAIIKANCPNTPIIVDAACCAGVTPESHDNALNAMKMIHIDVINQGEEPWRK